MKSCIFILIALSMGAALADTQEFTKEFTTTISSGTNNKGGYYGACFNLTNSTFASTVLEGQSITLPSEVELTSISFTAPGDGSSSLTSAKLAIYEHTRDGTTGNFIAISENVVTWSAGNAITFNFGDSITLSPSAKIQCLFVVSTATADDVKTFEGYKNNSGTMRIVVGNQNGDLPSGFGTYTSNTINTWESKYLPQVTIKTQISVPEPTTATLSLLALVGLVTRRRRQA